MLLLLFYLSVSMIFFAFDDVKVLRQHHVKWGKDYINYFFSPCVKLQKADVKEKKTSLVDFTAMGTIVIPSP